MTMMVMMMAAAVVAEHTRIGHGNKTINKSNRRVNNFCQYKLHTTHQQRWTAWINHRTHLYVPHVHEYCIDRTRTWLFRSQMQTALEQQQVKQPTQLHAAVWLRIGGTHRLRRCITMNFWSLFSACRRGDTGTNTVR